MANQTSSILQYPINYLVHKIFNLEVRNNLEPEG